MKLKRSLQLCSAKSKLKLVRSFSCSLRHSNKISLIFLRFYAGQNIVRWSADNFSDHSSFALGTHITYLPETEDVLSLKRGQFFKAMPPLPCSKESHLLCNVEKKPTIRQTKNFLMSSSSECKMVFDKFEVMSMLTYSPVFAPVLIGGVHPALDIYAIIQIEPMHTQSFEISKLLKQCLLNHLLDSQKKSTSTISSFEDENLCQCCLENGHESNQSFPKETDSSSPV